MMHMKPQPELASVLNLRNIVTAVISEARVALSLTPLASLAENLFMRDSPGDSSDWDCQSEHIKTTAR